MHSNKYYTIDGPHALFELLCCHLFDSAYRVVVTGSVGNQNGHIPKRLHYSGTQAGNR